MKTKWCLAGFLMLVLSTGAELRAQQSALDRKQFEEQKAKAEAGDPFYQCAVGEVFDFGLFGLPKDANEAVKWYRKAAQQNFAQAEYDLGSCYAEGQGVMKDDAEAVKWYRKAADQNLPKAEYNLGVEYYFGRKGVPQDYFRAFKWFRKAAEQGLSRAQFNLGICYVKAEGTPKDYIEGYKWLNLAAAQNLEDAKQVLAEIEGRMTSEQIAEAQRLSAAFVPRKKHPDQIPILVHRLLLILPSLPPPAFSSRTTVI